MDTITINNLTKKFGKVVAVDGISFSIRKGEIFGLLGPNGAGKTTTLMILSTLLKPTGGSAVVNGFDVAKNPSEVRESIGMVFQDPSSDELLTGYENLKLHALLYDIPLSKINSKVNKVLSLVDLTDRKDDIVKKYSGGMRRRMEIARGLIHEPKILFLDEPTLGLDPQTRKRIWEYIRILARKMKMTIILTTHYMEEAEELCDRIAIIDKGKIVALDTPVNLMHSIGGDIITLKNIKGNVPHEDKIRALPFVGKVVSSGSKAGSGDSITRVYVDDAAKHLQKILAEAGPVDSVSIHSPGMNDVFLHYTGRQIREESGGVIDVVRKYTNARQNK